MKQTKKKKKKKKQNSFLARPLIFPPSAKLPFCCVCVKATSGQKTRIRGGGPPAPDSPHHNGIYLLSVLPDAAGTCHSTHSLVSGQLRKKRKMIRRLHHTDKEKKISQLSARQDRKNTKAKQTRGRSKSKRRGRVSEKINIIILNKIASASCSGALVYSVMRVGIFQMINQSA